MVRSPPVEKKPKQPFVLPKPNGNMRRVFAYLKMIYESKKYHNAVFVGYDTTGIPRHAHKRGTGSKSTYKGNAPNGSQEYSFHWHGRSPYVCLFEAPIDMLSFISMHKSNWKSNWKQHSYAASCSVSDKVLFRMLEDNPNLKEVLLCFDNDEAGQNAAQRISDKLFLKGIKSKILIPKGKDWNEDLLTIRAAENESEVAEPCQMSLS